VLHIRSTITIYSAACPCYHYCDDDDFGHDCTSALDCENRLFYLAIQIVKQSAAASVQPSTTISNQGSPSVPASVQASVPMQQPSPSQPSTVVSSSSVSSSPQASAVVQGTSGVSPKISPQPSPAAQQVVPQYSPVDGQDQYGR
jgi:hypothetical protein